MKPPDMKWLPRVHKHMASRHLLVLGVTVLTVALMLWAHQVVLPNRRQQHTVHTWARRYQSGQTAADCSAISQLLWKRPHLHPAAVLAAPGDAAEAPTRADNSDSSSSSSSSSNTRSGSGASDTQSANHLTDMAPDDPMASSRQQLQQYISSPEFAAQQADMLAQQQLKVKRGILIVAGGKKLTAQLVVLLKVLREVVHCKLAVEIAWLGDKEMDKQTLAALQQHFGPLTGFNVQAVPFPSHHREVPRTHWVGKVAALLHCSFHEVLLLDADNIPLSDPGQHFSDPVYRLAGNLFWPDFWSDWVRPGVWAELGLNSSAVQPLLSAGAGWSGRDAETGMLLIDRARWLGVLHWVFWVNTWHDRLYGNLLHGDKDTFALGFALAGQAQHYRQVAVPPGGVFQWASGALHVKCPEGECGTLPGWQMLGALQHDNYGRAAFFHRTINKLLLHEEPWPANLATGPLPRRWAHYYLAHNSQGPTKGVHNIHAAPDSAFQKLHIDLLPRVTVPTANGSSWLQHPAHITLQSDGERDRSSRTRRHLAVGYGVELPYNHSYLGTASNSSSSSSRECPLVMFSQYLQAVQLALPIHPQPELECACSQLLQQLLQAKQDDLIEDAVGKVSRQQQVLQPHQVLSAQYLHGVVKDQFGSEVPDGSPVPALLYTEQLQSVSSVFGAIKQSHVAFEWLKRDDGKAAFPSLFDGSMV